MANLEGPRVPVFPEPLVITAFPPPLRCLCTWAWSPTIYGTKEKPYVLKIYYGLCPVRGHRTRASIGVTIDWITQERKRVKENGETSQSGIRAKGSGRPEGEARKDSKPKKGKQPASPGSMAQRQVVTVKITGENI